MVVHQNCRWLNVARRAIAWLRTELMSKQSGHPPQRMPFGYTMLYTIGTEIHGVRGPPYN